MSNCKTCRWWRKLPDDVDGGGICDCPKIRESTSQPDDYQPDQLVYSYYESGSFWTGPEFGCVHHTRKEA